MKFLYPHFSKWLFAILFMLVVSDCFPAGYGLASGARSVALAGFSSALPGVEALFGNPAGLASDMKVSLYTGHESRFMIREYAVLMAGVAIPGGPGVWGGVYRQFGSGIYRERCAGFSFARPFGPHMMAGLRFEAFSASFPGQSHTWTGYSAEAGWLQKISSAVTLGIRYSEPYRGRIERSGLLSFPRRRFSLGEVWHISNSLHWMAEVEKNRGRPWLVRSALEWMAADGIVLRAGVSGSPFCPSGGAGFHFGKFAFDIAYSYQHIIGFTPSVGIKTSL
jgi:hypothetical protein